MKPKSHLNYYSKVYPQAWKHADMFRSLRGQELPFWPDWCFMPLSGAFSIVTHEADAQGIDPSSPDYLFLINDVGIVGALAAWRVTQGVYRFDPEVFQELIATPVSGDLPHEILFRLPEWCLYIETPGLTWTGMPLNGFFVHLEYDTNDGRKELRFVLDHTPDIADVPLLRSFPIHLGEWTLDEALKRALAEAQQQSKQHGILPAEIDFNDPGLADELEKSLHPIVSLVLYICSINAEITGEGSPEKPKPKKTKKGHRLFPPPKPRKWDVGVRLGTSLRKARVEEVDREEHDESQTSLKRSPRPHIRRAHWHLYWTGPRDGVRKPVLKWLPTIPVGIQDDEDDLPVIIHPVE